MGLPVEDDYQSRLFLAKIKNLIILNSFLMVYQLLHKTPTQNT